MSQRSGCYVGSIILLSFIAPMVFVILLLNWLDVGEHVFPIMIPVFLAVGAFLIFTGVLAFVIRMSTRRRSELENSIARTYEAQLFADDKFRESGNVGAVFMIPTYCSYCHNAIDLQRVTWTSSMTLVCSNCGSQIRVRISKEDSF